MGLNRNMLGRVFTDGQVLEVTQERIAAYAAATNTDLPVYRDGGDLGEIMAPPMFGVVSSREVMALAITDTQLKADLPRLLHAEQIMRFLEPIRVGDRLVSESEIVFFDDKRSGEIFDLAVRTQREDGTQVFAATVSLFIRAEERKAIGDLLPAIGQASHKPTPVPSEAPVLWSAGVEVALDQAQRYSLASGDNNPIHINPDFAKAVGFSGCILHGLCTMAMAQNALIDQVTQGDPRRLKELRGRFSRPVMLGDSLRTQARRINESDGVTQYAYEVLNQDGKAVIKEGRASVSA